MEPPSTPGQPDTGAARPRPGAPCPPVTGGAAGEAADPAVAEVLAELLALARTLDELDLDGVEPLLGPPRWA